MATKIDIVGWQNMYVSANNTVNNSVNIRKSYSTDSAVVGQLTKSDRYKLLSYGYKTGEDDSQKWYAIELPNGSVGYCRKDKLQFYTVTDKNTYSDNDLKTFTNDLIAINKSIYLRLLQSAALLEQAKNAGKNTSSYDATFKELNDRYAARQKELQQDNLIKTSTGFNSAWQKAYNIYKGVLSWIGAIGVAPAVVAAIVVAITAVAGVSAYAVYQSLKPKYDSSVTDLKQSDKLKAALESLTAADRNEVVEDLEKQIDDAYNQGKSDGTFSGYWGIIKPLAIAAAGWYLINLFINKNSRRR